MDMKHEPEDLGSITLALRGRLEPAEAGDELVTASVGPDNAAIALWAAPAAAEALLARTEVPGWATFPNARADQVAVRVTRHDPTRVSVVEIHDLDIAHAMVQPLPGGRTLVVGARCQWRPEGPERNAVIFDANGRKVAEGTLGDGIEEVLATPSGRIWVGYFDEGVYGNYGWGGPGPEPIGSHGLVQFTDAFEMLWQYPYDAEGGAISDAYALNVDAETAWSCYYTDFPVVRIDAGLVQTWKNTGSSPRAIAVSETRCAMLGGYGADRNRLLVGQLTPGGFEPTHRAEVTLPGHVQLPRHRVVARGATLHFFMESDWYSLSLHDLPV
jgi:hypothetical protein